MKFETKWFGPSGVDTDQKNSDLAAIRTMNQTRYLR